MEPMGLVIQVRISNKHFNVLNPLNLQKTYRIYTSITVMVLTVLIGLFFI